MWFKLSVRNLFRNIRRTIAILCTIALGTGALFSFDGFINGVLKEMKESTIHTHYGYGQIFTKGYRDQVYEDPTKHWIEEPAAIETDLSQIPSVEHTFPRVSFSALIKHGNTTVSGFGEGIEAAKEADYFYSLNLEEGKMLTEEANGILLGKGLAKALRVEPGDKVTVIATSTKGLLSRDQFVVTGIFHTGNVDFDSRMFRIQLPAAQKLLKTHKIESLTLGLAKTADWEKVAKLIEKLHPQIEATSFDVLDKINYQNAVDWLTAQFNVVLVIILSIVVLGIFNGISASILERRQEIGNLRANGESVFQVMRLVMTEGALLAILGSALGMFACYTVLMLFINKGLLMPPGPGSSRQFVVTFSFTWPMVFFTFTMSFISALFASFLAGIKVAKMSIAKALA